MLHREIFLTVLLVAALGLVSHEKGKAEMLQLQVDRLEEQSRGMAAHLGATELYYESLECSRVDENYE